LKILIIKHGALGDWILATGAFKLIRKKYPSAFISLLTNSAYSEMARKSPWFDEVIIDNRRGFFSTLKILCTIYKRDFSYVFDLQNSQRTFIYYYFLRKSNLLWIRENKRFFRFLNPTLNLHALERLETQLLSNGINEFPAPDISWLTSNNLIRPKENYALIIPGGSKHRPQKRWIVNGYVNAIEWLGQRNIHCYLIGTSTDAEIINMILKNSNFLRLPPRFLEASFAQLADLARDSVLSLGSDTGPMHIVAIAGSPCLTLFSRKESNVKTSKPFGNFVKTIEVDDLKTLSSNQVIDVLQDILEYHSRNLNLID
jgi:ADP-heptose:LPS heptosyltransferase